MFSWGWWRDRWAFTRHNDIGKGICHLGGEKGNEQKWLELASHGAISEYQNRFHDQFAQLVDEPRRKLRPAGLLPLLDIYRAWHNLCHQDRSGLTPAQQMLNISTANTGTTSQLISSSITWLDSGCLTPTAALIQVILLILKSGIV